MYIVRHSARAACRCRIIQPSYKCWLLHESVNAASATVWWWDGLEAEGQHNHGVERIRDKMGQNRVREIPEHHSTKLQVSKHKVAVVAVVAASVCTGVTLTGCVCLLLHQPQPVLT